MSMQVTPYRRADLRQVTVVGSPGYVVHWNLDPARPLSPGIAIPPQYPAGGTLLGLRATGIGSAGCLS